MISRNNPRNTVFNILDVAGEVVNFLSLGVLLPVSLSCRGLNAVVGRVLGSERMHEFDGEYFTSSVSLVRWAIAESCGTELLCYWAAKGGHFDVLK